MIMLRNMFYVFKYHALPLYVCMLMFMGLDARMLECSSILLLGQRVGDVTVWYQSSGCSMGLNGP